MKNVAQISGATFLAQLLPIAISPLLTRMFTPEEFGLTASYLAIAGILAVVATGRLENAIVISRSNRTALAVARVVVALGSSVALITFVASLVFWIIGVQFIHANPLYFLLPLSVILTTYYTTMLFWTNRQTMFGTIAVNRLLQATINGCAQLSGGLAGLGPFGLVGAVVASQFASVALFVFRSANIACIILRPPSRRHIGYVVGRYWRFPVLDAPAALLITLSSQFPNVLLSTTFSPAVAGFFFLTQRVLQAPVTLIASAFLEVFRQRASRDRNMNGTMRPIFLQTFAMLLSISLPLSIVLYLTIVDVFRFLFGNEWHEAGVYAKYLVPAMGLRLIANPLSYTLNIVGWQAVHLVCSIVLACVSVATIMLAETPHDAVIGLSIVFSAVYLVYLFLGYLASDQ